MSPRTPMLLRRGLMIAPTLVVDSDPERPAGLVDVATVSVVVRDVVSGAREAFALPARDAVPVLGVVPDRAANRVSTEGASWARGVVGATA